MFRIGVIDIHSCFFKYNKTYWRVKYYHSMIFFSSACLFEKKNLILQRLPFETGE